MELFENNDTVELIGSFPAFSNIFPIINPLFLFGALISFAVKCNK